MRGRTYKSPCSSVSYLYQAVLRAELCERLPVRWNAVERGTADLADVPRRVIEHFSRRRAEILEHMAARGEHSAWAAQIATLETRRRKEYGVPADRLRAEWRARAAEHGLHRLHGELLDGAAQLLAWADYLERRAAVELAAELAELESAAIPARAKCAAAALRGVAST